jgi:hypothetical protein
MAVDTKAKRFSMLAFGSGGILPDPDGTIAAADRAHLLWLYSGLALTGLLGPYTMEAGEIYQAGMVAGEVFQGGAVAGEVFQAGAVAGEVI